MLCVVFLPVHLLLSYLYFQYGIRALLNLKFSFLWETVSLPCIVFVFCACTAKCRGGLHLGWSSSSPTVRSMLRFFLVTWCSHLIICLTLHCEFPSCWSSWKGGSSEACCGLKKFRRQLHQFVRFFLGLFFWVTAESDSSLYNYFFYVLFCCLQVGDCGIFLLFVENRKMSVAS